MTAERGFPTRCIHAGEAPDPSTGAFGVPMYANVTYAFRSFEHVEAMRAGEAPHFTYSPRGNPTVRSLELKLANLEGAETAIATASGMAAISATLLALLRDGGHLVVSDQIYDLTRDFLRHDLPALGGSATMVDITDHDAIRAALRPETRAIYLEPVSNPMLVVADVPAVAAVARAGGVPLVVDNTFLSPALFRPLEHGADIVLHSATKYLSGFGQVQGGVIAGRRELLEPIRSQMISLGGQMPPFSAWLLLQGVKTLPMRCALHSANAARLAEVMRAHPAVAEVHYPGLPGHPGHDLATRLFLDGRGGMISVRLTGGRVATAAFVDALEIATIAVSLGDVGTLVWPWHERDLVRISVGIEDGGDLEADIRQALDRSLLAVAPVDAPRLRGRGTSD